MTDSQRIDPVLVEKARDAHRRAREQISYFGASDYDGPGPVEAVIEVVFDELRLKEEWGTGGRRVENGVQRRMSLEAAERCAERDKQKVFSRFRSDWRLVEQGGEDV